MNEINWEALAAPLNPADIKTKPGEGGGRLSYIDARTIQDRLNQVCPGMWRFEIEILVIERLYWVVKGRLSVGDTVREDIGIGEGIEKNNKIYGDPEKSAASDALKRCAVHYGIGRQLYNDGPRAPQNAPQQAPAPAPHWTTTQDWPQFWTWTKNVLKLTDDEVHAALGVESVKDVKC
jgi:hypothetical protein